MLKIGKQPEAWDKTSDHVDAFFFALASSLRTASFRVREMLREHG
jgi:hypothetical protein